MENTSMFIYQTQLEGKVKEIIESSLLSQGYELVKVRLKGAGRDKTLLVMLDRIDGIGISVEDCQKASQSISVLLDVEDPIEGRYSLEVSSPGISRPLTRHKDFVAHKGTKIKVITKLSVEGRKSIYGILSKISESAIVVEDKELEQTFTINFDNILESHLYVDFGRGSDERRGKQGIGVSKEQNTKGGESFPRRRASSKHDTPENGRNSYSYKDNREERSSGRDKRKERTRREKSGFHWDRDKIGASPRVKNKEYPGRESSTDRRQKRADFKDKRHGAKSYSFQDKDTGLKREYTPPWKDSSEFNKKPERDVENTGASKGYRPRKEGDMRRTRVDEGHDDRRDRSEYSRREGSRYYGKPHEDFSDNRNTGYRYRKKEDRFESGRKEFGGSNTSRRRFDDNADYGKKKGSSGTRKSSKGRLGNYNNRKGS